MDPMELARFERQLIQEIINKQADIRCKNFGWGIAIISAVSVSSLAKDIEVSAWGYLVMSSAILALFAVFDIVHQSEFFKVVDRSEKVEEALRNNCTDYDGPRIESILKQKKLEPRAYKGRRFLSHYGLLALIILFTFFTI